MGDRRRSQCFGVRPSQLSLKGVEIACALQTFYLARLSIEFTHRPSNRTFRAMKTFFTRLVGSSITRLFVDLYSIECMIAFLTLGIFEFPIGLILKSETGSIEIPIFQFSIRNVELVYLA